MDQYGSHSTSAQVAETWIMFLVVRISTDPSQSQEQAWFSDAYDMTIYIYIYVYIYICIYVCISEAGLAICFFSGKGLRPPFLHNLVLEHSFHTEPDNIW